ncbi:putative stAR-related lipid transfer protein 3 isoform X1, partial [Apostichopus japonicus]
GTGQEPSCPGQGSNTKFTDVVILISSFIIVWFELWILDFKVIKRERRLNVAAAASSHRDTDEQSPLLSNQSSTNHDTNRSSRRKKHQEFYSPFDSPADSDLEDVNDEDDQFSGKESSHSYGAVSASNFESLPNSQRGSTINLAASLQEQAFIQKSEDSLHAFQEFLDGEYDWTVVKSLETATISICTADIALNQILFKLEAVLPATPEHIFTLMWDKCEDSINWNPTVKHVEVVQEIGCDMQVLYTVANSILVSSR